MSNFEAARPGTCDPDLVTFPELEGFEHGPQKANGEIVAPPGDPPIS
jgi:hypothetical protein